MGAGHLSFFMSGAILVQPGATRITKHGVNGIYKISYPCIDGDKWAGYLHCSVSELVRQKRVEK